LQKLAKRVRSGKLKLDAIVIETTGMADPAPVAQTFFVDDEVKAFARLDGIVTMVDAKHIEQHLDEEKPEGAENEAVEQVAFADRLLLNKCDLVTDEKELERITKRLRDINKFAPVQRCTNSQVSVDSVLDIKGFDLARTLEMDPEFLNTDGSHEHDSSVTSLGINTPGSLDLDLIQAWVGDLLQNKGTDIFRMKGVLSIAGHDSKFVYQAVHMIFNGNFTEPWDADEPRVNKLTFIGKNLDHEELKQGFMACIDTQDARDKRFKNLRFGVGTRVECNTGETAWKVGTVVKIGWDTGTGVAPYQVKLDSGDLIFAPADVDDLVRKAP
jgi:G3E family GTPase